MNSLGRPGNEAHLHVHIHKNQKRLERKRLNLELVKKYCVILFLLSNGVDNVSLYHRQGEKTIRKWGHFTLVYFLLCTHLCVHVCDTVRLCASVYTCLCLLITLH